MRATRSIRPVVLLFTALAFVVLTWSAADVARAIGPTTADLRAAVRAETATALALSCEDAIGPEWAQYLADGGRALDPTQTAVRFAEGEGRECWWWAPDGGRTSYFAVGWAPFDETRVAQERSELLATGSFATDPGDPSVVRAIEREFTNMAELVHLSWRYHQVDGWWFYVADAWAVPEEGVPVNEAFGQWSSAIATALEANVLAAATLTDAVSAEPGTPTESGPTESGSGFTADEPSTLSGLRTVAEVSLHPAALGACAAAALVMTALVGLPGRLIDSALGARYESWHRLAMRAARPIAPTLERVRTTVARTHPAVVITIGIVVASVFAALVDPRFGFNEGSARLLATLVAAFAIENVVGLLIVGRWLSRRGARTRLRLLTGSLLIVLVSAMLSRLAGFEPGFVFGLVLALSLVNGDSSPDVQRRRGLAEITWLFALGIGSWLLYSILTAIDTSGWGAVGLAATELFAGLAVGSLLALPIVLLPLRGMIGHDLWRAGRVQWLIAYLVAAATCTVVVLPLPVAWGEVDAPFLVWAVAFGVYALISTGVWAVLSYVPDAWLDRHAGDAPASARDDELTPSGELTRHEPVREERSASRGASS